LAKGIGIQVKEYVISMAKQEWEVREN
jgi:hypothetical protein